MARRKAVARAVHHGRRTQWPGRLASILRRIPKRSGPTLRTCRHAPRTARRFCSGRSRTRRAPATHRRTSHGRRRPIRHRIRPVPDGTRRRTRARAARRGQASYRARLFADPTRARLIGILMAGSADTRAELAQACGVAPSTTSGHLDLLTGTGAQVVHDPSPSPLLVRSTPGGPRAHYHPDRCRRDRAPDPGAALLSRPAASSCSRCFVLRRDATVLDMCRDGCRR